MGRRRRHGDAGHYFNVVFFDSYESAMENSSLPETQRFSAELMGFAEGPPTFHDLDIIDDRSARFGRQACRSPTERWNAGARGRLRRVPA